MKKIRVVELFAGIGAWKKALDNLKIPHEIVLAVENDKYPITAYNAIHNTNFKPIDITKLDERDVPDCDMICYSPPCQSWSAAGKQLGFDDKRGILFFDALRIIKAKQPKYAIMENVKNLTSKKFKHEFSEMLAGLEEAGYKNYWKVLNAKDYNICQNRERVFIVSIRKDIDQEFEFPKPIPLTQKLTDILEEDAMPPILHNIYGGFKEDNARVFEEYSPTIRTSAGGGHIPSVVVDKIDLIQSDIFAIIDNTYKSREPRIYIKYSPTIRSERQGFKIAVKKNNTWKLFKEDKADKDGNEYYLIRNMTALEAFRLMGFDDDDYFKAKNALNSIFYKGKNRSNSRLYKLAGNSIVINVIEELYKQLFYKYINTKDKELVFT